MSEPVTDIEINLCLDKIEELGIDHLFVSTQSYGLPVAERFVNQFRKRFTDSRTLRSMPVIAGGWGPTLEPEKTLEWADYVIFGEGEKPLIDILRGADPKDVNNSIYSRHGKLIRNPVYELLTTSELSDLPFQAYHNSYMVEDNRIEELYQNGIGSFYIFCGRGCPNNCAYCLAGQRGEIYRGTYELKKYLRHQLINFDRVLAEIKYAKECYGIKRIVFTDEIFPWDNVWLELFFKYYPKEIDLPFHAVVIPELHGFGKMKRLINMGMDYTSVAFQSAAPKMLKMYNRSSLSAEGANEFAQFLTDHSIPFDYKIIAHNPFETEEDMKITLKWLWNAPITRAVLVFQLNQFPGTKLTKMIKEQKPQGMPETVINWYCFLYCLGAMGKTRRNLSKIIYKYNLFKHHVGVMAWTYKMLFQFYAWLKR